MTEEDMFEMRAAIRIADARSQMAIKMLERLIGDLHAHADHPYDFSKYAREARDYGYKVGNMPEEEYVGFEVYGATPFQPDPDYGTGEIGDGTRQADILREIKNRIIEQEREFHRTLLNLR